MTHKHSILSLAIGLFSALFIGCASDGGGAQAEDTTAAQAGMKAEGKGNGGYGYEMIDLHLVAGDAPAAGDALTPNGRVAPEEVQRLVTARVPALRTCYEAALSRDGSARGRVVVRLHVEASGKVASSKVESSSIGDTALGDCITNELGSISFPASKGEPLEVVYPIELAPEDLAKSAPAGA